MKLSIDIDGRSPVALEVVGAWTVEARQDRLGALAAVAHDERLQHLVACDRCAGGWNFDRLRQLSIPTTVKAAVKRAVRRLP